MSNVTISVEGKRGCGYRTTGGVYLVGSMEGEVCERLPFPLEVCSCCGHGIRPSRGFQWIQPQELFAYAQEPLCDNDDLFGHRHGSCPMCRPVIFFEENKAGLLWIGMKFYPTPRHFILEAKEMGISRKLKGIPRGFEIGEDYVFLAHRKAISEHVEGDVVYTPGVFYAWRPEKVQIVVEGPDDVPERALNLQERHGEDKVELVQVIRKDQLEMQMEVTT